MKLFKWVCVVVLFLFLIGCPLCVSGQNQNPITQKQAEVEELVKQFQFADGQAQWAFDRAVQNLVWWKKCLLIFNIRPRPSAGKIADDWNRYDRLNLRRHVARAKTLVALEETKILAQKLTGKEKEQFDKWRKEIEKKLFASPAPSRLSRAGFSFHLPKKSQSVRIKPIYY